MLMYDYIPKQLKEIKLRISQAAVRAGRDPKDVVLIAVSKTFPVEAILAAYQAGQRLFGENRVQELASKVPMLPDDIQWHLIGHLQGNKAGVAIKLSDTIEAVDSEKLVRRLDRLAEETGKMQKILLEFNISGEGSKFGETADAAFQISETALKLSNIKLHGLMTMAPFGAEDCELHKIFSGLRELRNNIEEKFDASLPELSMGMSSDYEIAIEEGATMVRIGSAIFGVRTILIN